MGQRQPLGGGPRLITPANAGALLQALIERPTAVILDSAPLVYNTRDVGARDRAFAACLTARAYSDRKDDEQALQWARRGLQLDTSLRSCQQIVQRAGRS